jgi:hypothetical protein
VKQQVYRRGSLSTRRYDSTPGSFFSSEKRHQFCSQFSIWPLPGGAARIHNEIKSARHRCARRSQNLSNSSLDPVSLVRFSEFSGSGQTETAKAQPVADGKQYKRTGYPFRALFVDLPEFRGIPQSHVLPESIRFRQAAVLCLH